MVRATLLTISASSKFEDESVLNAHIKLDAKIRVPVVKEKTYEKLIFETKFFDQKDLEKIYKYMHRGAHAYYYYNIKTIQPGYKTMATTCVYTLEKARKVFWSSVFIDNVNRAKEYLRHRILATLGIHTDIKTLIRDVFEADDEYLTIMSGLVVYYFPEG